MSERDRILRHLDVDYTQPVRDPIWHHIYLSGPLLEITQSPEFHKLHGIKQLGPVYLLYPGATHTRFSHSLGVFHLARRMITQLVRKDERGLYTLQDVKTFLCAALLHDVGHFPFTHSLKDVGLKHHEHLTAEIITSSDPLMRLIETGLGVPAAHVAAIIDFARPVEPGSSLGLYRNLLSGVLDPDKLDYLNRDAYFCGIPYGTQDIDFIFNEIEPHPDKGLSISRKGLASVESVLFGKYLMYRNVYWHRVVRLVTAMIKKAILMGLGSRVISASDLYGIDDQEFSALMTSVSYPPFELVRDALARRLHRTVATTAFEDNSSFHHRLVKLENRLEYEAELAAEASSIVGRRIMPEEIIIDLPEAQSFEIDVPVHEDNQWVLFAESGTVFSGEVVTGFTRSLRGLSLLCSDDDGLAAALRTLDPLGAGLRSRANDTTVAEAGGGA